MAQGIQTQLQDLIKLKQPAMQLIQVWGRAGMQAVAGSHRSHVKGRGMDFEEVRHYQYGDDIRLMDWKVTARTGKAHIKIYREEKERPVFLLVDQSSSMFFGSKQALKSVMAAEIAALIGWKSILQHDRLSAILVDDKQSQFFAPSSREHGLLPFLKALSEVKPRKPKSKHPDILADGLEKLRKVVKPGAFIYIVSDFLSFNQTALRHLTRIAQHAEIKVCLVRDPFEFKILPQGILNITDGMRDMMINLTKQETRNKLQNSFNEEIDLLKNIFRRHGIHYTEFLPSDNSIVKLKQSIS